MLLFYSLDSRGYEGFMNGSESIAERIVNSGKVGEFQEFLKENGIEYQLYGCEVDGRKSIYCHFDNKDADFFKIASTGTRSLALFYYFETDIIEVLREGSKEIEKLLMGLSRKGIG